DGEHALARVFHRLLDGHRHLAGLAVAEADAAFAVADHGQRGEGELAAALDGLADAVDRDQLLDHAVVDFLFAVAVAIATPRLTLFCHLLFPGWLDMYGSCAACRCGLPRFCVTPPQKGGGARRNLRRQDGPAEAGPQDQNCRPPSRAASARALMRPWNR